MAKFTAGVLDTSGKFATGVVDTGGAPWLANITENFQKKIYVIGGFGEDDSWKKPEANKFARLSLSEEDTDGDVVIKPLNCKQF